MILTKECPVCGELIEFVLEECVGVGLKCKGCGTQFKIRLKIKLLKNPKVR